MSKLTKEGAENLVAKMFKVIRELDYAPAHSSRTATENAVDEFYTLKEEMIARLTGEEKPALSFEEFSNKVLDAAYGWQRGETKENLRALYERIL